MRRIALIVGTLLVACGGTPEEDRSYTQENTGGAVVDATGGTATGGAEETGGDATGGIAVDPVCEPGRAVTCPCVGGAEDGVQSCRDDGSGWTECECPNPPETGGSGNGGTGAGGEGGSPEPCIEGAHYASDGRLVWLPTDPMCDCVQAVEVILVCSHGEIVHKVCDEPQCL